MKTHLGVFAILAALLPFAAGCNSILGINDHTLVDGGGGTGGGAGNGGTGGAGVLACDIDAGVSEEVDAAMGTACGFTMPNPAGSTGLPNVASYTPNPQDGSVTDNVTKLIWEGTVDPALYRQIDAAGYCAAKGGDWRLPTRIELVSLLDFTVSNPNPIPPPDPTTVRPMINTTFFPNTPAEKFWTSSYKPGVPTTGWTVGFDFGNTRQKPTSDSYRVRCVRRPPSQCPPAGYQVQADGTVLDVGSGLTWQRSVGQKQDWIAATTFCSTTFGSGWRLPSLTELQTLVDETKENPSIVANAFPCTPISDYFWSSSPYVGDSNWAYYVTFIHGHSDIQVLSTPSFVRCVTP